MTMRSYVVPGWLREDIGASSLRLESIELVAATASGNALEWAERVIATDQRELEHSLAACGVCNECEDDRYYGLLDPEYPEPLVIAVIHLDPEDNLRRWNGSGWDEVPPEMEPSGYQFVSLDGGMLADALRASGGMLLRPTEPKARHTGTIIAAGDAYKGKCFAIVDDFDTSAVLDLIEVRPGPVAFVRRDGKWVEDGAILGRLRSVDPPRVVQVDPGDLDAITKQVDEFDRAHADNKALVARAIVDDSWAAGTGLSRPQNSATTIAPRTTATTTKTTAPARRRTSGSSKWDETKYNRVDGKFAPKGAVDTTPTGMSSLERHAARGRALAEAEKAAKKAAKKTGGRRARGTGSARSTSKSTAARRQAADYSPTGAAAKKRSADGSVLYADGTRWDPVARAFKDAKGNLLTNQSPKRPPAALRAQSTAAKKAAAAKKTAAAPQAPDPIAIAQKQVAIDAAKWEVRRRKADLAEQQRRSAFNQQMSDAYAHYDPTAGKDQLSQITEMVLQEQARRRAYDSAAAYEAQAEEIRRLEQRIKLGLVASVGDRSAVLAAVPEHSTMPHDLKSYWVRGKGAAKIRWGVGGDFNRCRRQLSKYLRPDQLAGACANLHKAATGTWPGKNRKHAVAAAAYDGNGAMVSLAVDPEVAAQLTGNVQDGNPPDDAHVTLAYLGEDVDPAIMEVVQQIVSGMALEYNQLPAYFGGRGTFMNDEQANYVSVDAPGVEGMWADLTDRLGRAGVPLPSEHGFTPHVTLKYGEMQDEEWPTLPVRSSLGTIEVHSGGDRLGSWELLP